MFNVDHQAILIQRKVGKCNKMPFSLYLIVVKIILVSKVEIVSKCKYKVKISKCKRMAEAYWERQKKIEVSYNKQGTAEDNRDRFF